MFIDFLNNERHCFLFPLCVRLVDKTKAISANEIDLKAISPSYIFVYLLVIAAKG